ncbi:MULTISPECIES: Ku protein [unclassified Phyllobacterium]|uniref:non-homologous end joining protein Ku n=1 Tax=Phyllobacterium TaxID=28100 RepID=UPI0015FD9C0A|nr:MULTISPECIES: Ku protein [unclassified Phyllobacterium]MBA8903582.1 DNA end-binding protein Ku [Phyllobacterium sp. P30BS-XVII]UGX89017.1 Ku protein [Phyllobacterium sp. T1293]
MAPHTFWKGYLKLSLVTCPVIMTPATTDNEKVRFHTLNRATGNRVVSEYIDSVSGKTVDDDDQVKGYERGEDEYIMLEDDELQAVALESTRTIDINVFVPHDSIEWIWYDKPHYLLPDDPVGEEAFSVIRDAMAATKTVGIARLVLYRRERAVMLEARDKGIIVWTLRYGDEVRNENEYFGDIKTAKPEAKSLDLMTDLIKERTKPWDTSMLGDPVQERLLDIISARKKGRKKPPKAEAQPERPSNVVNIMDALKKSLAAEGKGSKKR